MDVSLDMFVGDSGHALWRLWPSTIEGVPHLWVMGFQAEHDPPLHDRDIIAIPGRRAGDFLET